MAHGNLAHGEDDRRPREFPANPFSPIFGGSPRAFFGRDEIIQPFREALDSPGNDYRTLFITGVRALGKTALLERLSRIAHEKGWEVFDLSSDHPIESLVSHLAPFDELTREDVPSGSVGALGLSASHGGIGTVEIRHLGTDDLCDLFVQRAAGAERGILVTIDEIQKVALEHDERICSAFQMASRKGHDVALVVIRLPSGPMGTDVSPCSPLVRPFVRFRTSRRTSVERVATARPRRPPRPPTPSPRSLVRTPEPRSPLDRTPTGRGGPTPASGPPPMRAIERPRRH